MADGAGDPRLPLACAVVVRDWAYLNTGGFSPLLGPGGEEQLLAIDLRKAGWMLTYAENVRVNHAPADVRRAGRRATQMRNEVLTAVMRRPVAECSTRHSQFCTGPRATPQPGAR
jgi:hypothetical protein